jgi:hypothetical protein
MLATVTRLSPAKTTWPDLPAPMHARHSCCVQHTLSPWLNGAQDAAAALMKQQLGIPCTSLTRLKGKARPLKHDRAS